MTIIRTVPEGTPISDWVKPYLLGGEQFPELPNKTVHFEQIVYKGVARPPAKPEQNMLTLAVIEWKPKVRPFIYRNNEYYTSTTYQIALPWQYLVIYGYLHRAWNDHDRSYVYPGAYLIWSPKQVADPLAQPLFTPTFPMIYDAGSICLGTHSTVGRTGLERYNFIVEDFWNNSEFHSNKPVPSKYKTMDDWQKDSDNNSLCWQDWPEWQREPDADVAHHIEQIARAFGGVVT